MSDTTGSSSNTTTTTGAPVEDMGCGVGPPPPKTIGRRGENTRNRSSTTSGTGARAVSHERTTVTRRYATVTTTATVSAPIWITAADDGGGVKMSLAACQAIRAKKPPTNTR